MDFPHNYGKLQIIAPHQLDEYLIPTNRYSPVEAIKDPVYGLDVQGRLVRLYKWTISLSLS